MNSDYEGEEISYEKPKVSRKSRHVRNDIQISDELLQA